jgi:hypothetical protein
LLSLAFMSGVYGVREGTVSSADSYLFQLWYVY